MGRDRLSFSFFRVLHTIGSRRQGGVRVWLLLSILSVRCLQEDMAERATSWFFYEFREYVTPLCEYFFLQSCFFFTYVTCVAWSGYRQGFAPPSPSVLADD